MELISKKDGLEAELKALGSVLESVSHLCLDLNLEPAMATNSTVQSTGST